MKLTLVSVDPFAPHLKFQLDKLPALIGRDTGVPVRIDDRWISHPHCELSHRGSMVRVRDLKSACGILVNGRSVRSSRLQSGDVLTVGVRSLRITFREAEPIQLPNKGRSRRSKSKATV